MNTKLCTTAILGAMCAVGSVQAGTVSYTNGLNDLSTWTSNYAAANAGAFAVESLSGTTGGTVINFASGLATTVSSDDGGNFYLGDASALHDGWFSGPARPSDSTQVLAFGNTQSFATSNSVTMSFAPGVSAFGFNYHDIESADLIINWDDGSANTVTIDQPGDANHGFFGMVADSGQFITSVQLVQSPNLNDGFSFYGFSTINVVPIPMAAWSGLALLIPMGIRRRTNRNK